MNLPNKEQTLRVTTPKRVPEARCRSPPQSRRGTWHDGLSACGLIRQQADSLTGDPPTKEIWWALGGSPPDFTSSPKILKWHHNKNPFTEDF
jgi:hypothetical protein